LAASLKNYPEVKEQFDQLYHYMKTISPIREEDWDTAHKILKLHRLAGATACALDVMHYAA